MRNVMLKVYEFNRAAIRAYEKAGFREFGRQHQAIEMNGQVWDLLYMECLRDDFDSPILDKVFQPDEKR
jgi:RimJ/RimL family protein N-acetyltransferase